MTLFRLDASISPATSASHAIADIVEAEWQAANPGTAVVRRDLGTAPLPADAWSTAVGAAWTPEESRTEAQRTALALAASLVDELTAADAALLAVPLYNFGIPQHVKAWIDLVITGSGSPTEPLLKDKPVVLVVVRGGAYGPGTPREGWDHSTDYLRRILVDVWGADLTVVEREFTLVGVTPRLEEWSALQDQI